MKGWYGLQSYLGYDTTSNKAIQGGSEDTTTNSNEGVGSGGAYGGLSGDDGVNPFQAAMSKQNGSSGAEDNLLNFVDDVNAQTTTAMNQKDDGWKSNDWGDDVAADKNDGWNDTWGDDSASSQKSTTKPKSQKAAKSPTPKVTKQDSWGNDVDEWEDWLNDDSTSYKPPASKTSPNNRKKGE